MIRIGKKGWSDAMTIALIVAFIIIVLIIIGRGGLSMGSSWGSVPTGP
ncbi:hypothetical protein JW826_02640 [Candidatus Woesearchaeota archaeon]|nr:hypothetical protein [Candidatus Woesearchaeota archaeon]